MHKIKNQDGFAHILLFIGIFAVVLIIGAYTTYRLQRHQDALAMQSSLNQAFITSSPINLDQTAAITKFRGCAGHDFSGDNVLTGREPASSLKHYVEVDGMYPGTNNKIKLYAPYDGKVADLGTIEKGDTSTYIEFRATAAPGYIFEFGHVIPLTNLHKGSIVKSGQLIGYAEGEKGDHHAFDLEFGYHPNFFSAKYTENLESYTTHMTAALQKQYTDYGFSQSNIIVSKAYRLANACKTNGKVKKGDAVFADDAAAQIVNSTKVKPAVSSVVVPPAGPAPTGAQEDTENSGSAATCAIKPGQQKPPGCY